MAGSRGAKRRIYFMEVVCRHQDDSIEPEGNQFWANFLAHVGELAESRRRLELHGRKYIGEARPVPHREASYLYMGKARRGADWPDVTDAHGIVTPLTLDGVDALIEPAYLLPVNLGSYVAVLRSSGGPTFAAIEEWITSAAGLNTEAMRYELRPYVRLDQVQRLDEAVGATKFEFKVEPGALDAAAEEDGEIAQALRAVQNIGGGGVSVDVIMSFGNARPDHLVSQHVAKEIKRALGRIPAKKAQATVVLSDEQGQWKTEQIDFIRDRVTGSEYVGASEDEQPTPQVVLDALYEAIRKFRVSIP